MPGRDWKTIARAHGLEAVGADVERLAGALETLDSVFQPLVKAIPAELEPAFEFHAAAEPES